MSDLERDDSAAAVVEANETMADTLSQQVESVISESDNIHSHRRHNLTAGILHRCGP